MIAGMPAQKIKAMENVHKKYQKKLLAEKVVKEDDLKRMQEHISGIMSKEFEAARDYKPEVWCRHTLRVASDSAVLSETGLLH